MASLSTDEISSSQEKNSDSADSQKVPGLVQIDGAIGMFKNRTFQALTNVGIGGRGFVSSGNNVKGYLIEVVPANCQCIDGDDSQR